MALTPFEMPPGYRWICKIQRGVAPVWVARLAWLGAAARNDAAMHPADTTTKVSFLTTSHLLLQGSDNPLTAIQARTQNGQKRDHEQAPLSLRGHERWCAFPLETSGARRCR
jgi:hypothetical protein